MNYRILPPDGYIEARVSVPLSKSMSNRALIIAALAGVTDYTGDLADCDDTSLMKRALSDPQATEVDAGAAGTVMRFLTAYYAARPDTPAIVIDGTERMRNRPIGALVDALRTLGADIAYQGEEGYPPLKITGRRLDGGVLRLDASVSSQFVSALLMIAPAMVGGLRLELDGDVVSRPYIDMTIEMMRRAGAEVEVDRDSITVAPGAYSPEALTVEADWSAASYWYELEAVASGEVIVDGLVAESCQGDKACARIFADLGVTTEYDNSGATLLASPDYSPRLTLDMADTPDLVPAIVVTCCMLGVPFRLTGLASLRIKETDRVEALCREMLKIGVILTAESDSVLVWEGERRPVNALPEFDTYDDHRMAMALSMISLYVPGIVIRDAEVVSKSFPGFWSQLESVGFRLLDGDVPLSEEGLPEE